MVPVLATGTVSIVDGPQWREDNPMAETPEVRVVWFKRSAVWRRITADVGALAVGGNAAYLSWGHIVHTSVLLHQTQDAAWLYPVSIDGMMIVGVVKAADDRANGRKVRAWARVSTWLGGSLSINAQVMSAWSYGLLAAAWSVVPAVTLIVVVEVQSRRGKLIVEHEAAPPVIADDVVSAVVPISAPPVAPVSMFVEPVATDDEPAPDDESVPAVVHPRRRRAKRRGYVGVGASDVEVDAMMDAVPALANGQGSYDIMPGT
jgi:hypothetical protein